MKDVLKALAAILMILFMVFGVMWIIEGNAFFMYKFFAPKQEQVRHEVYENSAAFNEGMAREIRSMQYDYAKSTPSQKDAIATMILHRVDGYDDTQFPADVRAFVHQLRSERGIQ